MKFALLLICLIALGGFLMFQYGGYATFDPEQQAKDARAAVTPGMAWTKVVDAIGEPDKYYVHLKEKVGRGTNAFEMIKIGPGVKFRREALAQRVNEGSLPVGFRFNYRFTTATAFSIVFDGTGTVTHLEDGVALPGIPGL